MTLRVLHLAGSAVSPFYADLSALYARGCLEAVADPDRYEHHVAWVSPDGTWRFPVDLRPRSIDAAAPSSIAEAVARIVDLGADVALPQMFCVPGMTTYRALLDLLAIPYVGNRPEVMALGADKAMARAVVSAAGIDVPPGEVLHPGERPTLRPPAVVKPVDADNSLGVSLVRNPEEWHGALDTAFAHSSAVLVERYIELGREVRCGIVERDGALLVLPLEEYAVDAERKPIRLHDDKITTDDQGLRLVAKDRVHAWLVDPADPATAAVSNVARQAHRALACRHYSLFDFRIDPDGRPWFLEASLYNSFSPNSVLTVMAAAAGLPLADLLGEAVRTATAGS